MKNTEANALDPLDALRCQADKPNGNTAFTLGGRPGLVRCTNQPTTVLVERQPGDDGLHGAMAVCDSCLAVYTQRFGAEHALRYKLAEKP